MPAPSAAQFLAAALAAVSVEANACSAQSPATQTPVLELYTSEGCSSCPPADRWLSGLKQAAAEGKVVAQAFHVGYWDYIGWVDRFATPAHTTRQRQIASFNKLRSIYTPQLVRNGADWRDYDRALVSSPGPAPVAIRIDRRESDAFEATIQPGSGVAAWAAYWSVTEHGHASKVSAGENAGESLRHDFVVRQYVPLGQYTGEQRVTLRAVAQTAGHARQVNLVVFDPKTGRALQGLSVQCG
jgi:hypothetical protein